MGRRTPNPPQSVMRCVHEPGRVLVSADELSICLPESGEYVQQVVSMCIQCGRVIYGLMVFLGDQPFGRVKWRSDVELTRGLRPVAPPVVPVPPAE